MTKWYVKSVKWVGHSESFERKERKEKHTTEKKRVLISSTDLDNILSFNGINPHWLFQGVFVPSSKSTVPPISTRKTRCEEEERRR
jgi:hypothetical protein